MIKYGAGLIVRAFVELGLVFFVCAAALCLVAYRIARLFVTPEPDRLDRLAAQLGTLLGRAAIARQAAAAVSLVDDDELEFSATLASPQTIEGLSEREAEESVDFWRSVVP